MPSGTPCLSAARAISRSQALSAPPALAALDINAIASAMPRSVLLILAAPTRGMKMAVLPGMLASAPRPAVRLRPAGLRLLRRRIRGPVLQPGAGRRVRRVHRAYRHGLDAVAGRS